MIPREIIDEIIYRNDIEDVISSYVTLKRAGSNSNGLCPFHSEKSPSFTVFPATKSFYCFGCGVGGDVITFIMKAENLDYQDALEFLAQRAGISIPKDGERAENGIPRKRIFEMNLAAAKFFRQCLFDPQIGGDALRYLSEDRRLSGAVIKHFGLGYSPNTFGMLTDHMKKQGFTDEELTVGFLCGKSQKTGRAYDYFRNRVMFPIIDVSGNIIAFGGRVMDDSKPKYKNSSDTPVFKKLRNLYALNFARHVCQDELVLCEGYMDVIALHSAGITNAVATLGTAITSEQARLMSRYTKRVVIAYDSDEAGVKAATRAMKMLEEVGLEVNVLSMSDAKDPDEYIKRYGTDKFKQLISNAKSKFDYNFDLILSKYDIMQSQDKINALHELERFISTVYSVAERDIYIRSVAKKFDVEYTSIKADIDRIIAKNAAAYKRGEAQRIKQESVGYADSVNRDFIKAPIIARNEETVLGLMLLYPEHRKRVFNEDLLCDDDFVTELNKRIFTAIKQAYAADDDRLVTLNESFTPEEMGRISKMKVARMNVASSDVSILTECIETLRRSVEKKDAKNTDTIDKLNEILAKKRTD